MKVLCIRSIAPIFILLAASVLVYGSAVEFNGTTAEVVVPDSPSLNIEDELTLEAWVFPKTIQGNNAVINKDWRPPMAICCYEMSINNGQLQAAIQAEVPAAWFWTGSGMVEAEKWSHIAVTYDGEKIKTYVNGVFQSEADTTGKICTNDAPFKVGRRMWGDGEPYEGTIDEVRVSSVVRYESNFDIPTHVFSPDEHTAILLHFDEGSGAETKDASENGNHGTLEGDARFVDVGAPISPLAIGGAGILATTWVEIKQE
jgi:hypothetical protein